MDTIEIDILDSRARKLIDDLAELNLISIVQPSTDGFLTLVNKLRLKAAKNPPSLEEITKEVEIVREKRHAKFRKKE